MGAGAIDYEDTLRRLTVNDQSFVRDILSSQIVALDQELEPTAKHLVRLGALIALEAGPATIDVEVGQALASGASRDDVVGVLLSVAAFVGSARLVCMAPRIANAIGFDVMSDLERYAGPTS